MYIFQDETDKRRIQGNGDLYLHYQENHLKSIQGTDIFSFHFSSRKNHTLKVEYPSSCYKMVFCINGYSETYLNNKKQYSFSPGKVLFYKANEELYRSLLFGSQDYKLVHFNFSESFADQLKSFAGHLFQEPFFEIPIPSPGYNIYKKSEELLFASPAVLPLLAERLILDQLILVSEQFGKHNLIPVSKKDQELLQEAKSILSLSDSFITTQDLAKQTGTNTFKLKQIFRELGKTSVLEFQLETKLNKALFLLKNSSLTVEEAARECGYQSTGSFSNAFYRRFGIRPSQVKNS